MVATALIGLRIASVWPNPETLWDRAPRRFWEDMHLAIGLFLHDQFPVQANSVVKARVDGRLVFLERYRHLARGVQETGVNTWEFWQTIPPKRFLRRSEVSVSRRFDDSGRPLLLGLAFKARGGVSPFLLLWIAPLTLVPVLIWLAWEFWTSGQGLAGAAFIIAVGLSSYVADSLALPYSAMGFYLVALFALVALSVYATAPGRQSLGFAHWGRLLGAGLVFAVCALCRGGVLLFLPAFAVAIAFAVSSPVRRRASNRTAWTRHPALVFVASSALFCTPYLAARWATTRLVTRTLAAHGQSDVPQQHAFWFGVWSGMGDFDRIKGHTWSDLAVWQAVQRAGGIPVTATHYDPANEALLRTLILKDIREDPAWYLTILGRRLWTTLLQTKLWPWRPWSGVAMAPATHANEGVIDAYYALTATAEWFGIGAHTLELPLPLLIAPLAVLGLVSRRRRRTREVFTVAPVLLAVLPLPVLVSTASALEPQAILVPYLLGAALLAQVIFATRRQSKTAGSKGRHPTDLPPGGTEVVEPLADRPVSEEL